MKLLFAIKLLVSALFKGEKATKALSHKAANSEDPFLSNLAFRLASAEHDMKAPQTWLPEFSKYTFAASNMANCSVVLRWQC
jgi:hypothetical protein